MQHLIAHRIGFSFFDETPTLWEHRAIGFAQNTLAIAKRLNYIFFARDTAIDMPHQIVVDFHRDGCVQFVLPVPLQGIEQLVGRGARRADRRINKPLIGGIGSVAVTGVGAKQCGDEVDCLFGHAILDFLPSAKVENHTQTLCLCAAI